MKILSMFSSSSSRLFPKIPRSEEHTSELQSRLHIVCRLLLEKKKTSHSTNNFNALNPAKRTIPTAAAAAREKGETLDGRSRGDTVLIQLQVSFLTVHLLNRRPIYFVVVPAPLMRL